MCIFPELRTVFRGCIYCQCVYSGFVGESYSKEERVITSMVVSVSYGASTFLPEKDKDASVFSRVSVDCVVREELAMSFS